MKKLLAMLLATVVLLSAFSLSAFACVYENCSAGDGGCPEGCTMCSLFSCKETYCLCFTVKAESKAGLDNFWLNIITPIRNMIIKIWTNLYNESPFDSGLDAPLLLPYTPVPQPELD